MFTNWEKYQRQLNIVRLLNTFSLSDKHSLYPNIQFTMIYNEQQILILDEIDIH